MSYICVQNTRPLSNQVFLFFFFWDLKREQAKNIIKSKHGLDLVLPNLVFRYEIYRPREMRKNGS